MQSKMTLLNAAEIEALWLEFEAYVHKVRHFMGFGEAQSTVKLWYEFLEWRGNEVNLCGWPLSG